MNLFSINGIARPEREYLGRSFEELICSVQERFTGQDRLIASIRVNGVEIGESDELALQPVGCDELESVEITLSHPREVAEETLQTLRIYTSTLADLSLKAADELEESPRASLSYQQLIEGIQTFVDSLDAVKQVLRIGILLPVNLLEADLLSTTRDLLQAHETADGEYRSQLLRSHLPECLSDWRDQGIPAMIQSRDS